MDPTQSPQSHTAGLTLTFRQLNAALRKFALRAQRLIDAFGLVVPTVRQPGDKPAKRLAQTKTTSTAC
jgi:hypothetical protein